MKPVVGTSIQYLLDGDTFVIRIQCCVLEVLYRIISNYLLLNLNHKTEDYRQNLQVKHKYGSIFEAYTPECYYYDLIDLIRRLILTGGLILIGSEQAVAQIFLGILISSIWFASYFFPLVVFFTPKYPLLLFDRLFLRLLLGILMYNYEW